MSRLERRFGGALAGGGTRSSGEEMPTVEEREEAVAAAAAADGVVVEAVVAAAAAAAAAEGPCGERRVFQNLIVRSAVPPPDARSPRWCGLQAIAFTAAQCSLHLNVGSLLSFSHTISLLSLPPDASCPSSEFQRRPQTSCLWPTSFWSH